MKINTPKRILIIKFRNIGDVLLTTPLIKNLKLNYPDALIDIAVNKGCEDMVTLNPYLNNVIIYDRNKIKKYNFLKRLKEELLFAYRIRKNRYDLIINTTKGDRGAQLALISNAKTKIGYKSNSKLDKVFDIYLPKQEFRHTLDMDLDTLRTLELKIFEKKVEIFCSKEDDNLIEKVLKDNGLYEKEFIHIHPVSRWLFKCINDKIMAAIIDFCELELNIKVILTAAPIEEERNKIESIMTLCKSKPLNLGGEFTLKQTASLNKKARAFIGVDTSIMHISAANDIPVLAFFGPSGTDHWGPWDNNCFESGYTKRNGYQRMGKHRVIAESRDCQPCGKDGCNGSKISDCLMNLDMQLIKKNIKEMILND
ncbi:MAG: putative lipopolysaccharide heptosyltransferase III [Aliarcobacter sp.]|jgi:heptosyltransferase-3|nr:putative lipopolysaccharide heptosyltransferase III [Aliarcobacter sp.]